MDAKILCPLCGEGHVLPHVREVETVYKGRAAMLPMHYQLCDTCTSDYAGMTESKLNKRIVMAFRKQIDGLLTGEEIIALRKQYKLTQIQAAQLFGGGPVAFCKYENDDVSQSEAMDTLLRLVRRSPEAFWALVEEKGMQGGFVEKRKSTRLVSKVVPITAIRTAAIRPDPHYNPRQFRRKYRQEALPCLK